MFTSDRDQVSWERLNRHPYLRTRVESLLEAVENAGGRLREGRCGGTAGD